MKTLFMAIALFCGVAMASAANPNNPPKINDIDNSCKDRGVSVSYENGTARVTSPKNVDFNVEVRRETCVNSYDTRSGGTGVHTESPTRTDSNQWDDGAYKNREKASQINIKCYDKK